MDETNPYRSPRYGGYASAGDRFDRTPAERAGGYRPAICWAVVQQAVILGFTGLLLDGGATFRLFLLPAIGFWPIVLMFVLRRPESPTRTDLDFVKLGYWLIAAPLVFVRVLGIA
ncbi:MAG: hypothetical protein JXB62_19195 [Pirellulales bacterium]|nr:hypothetical protein [Pirellulales bacterium]